MSRLGPSGFAWGRPSLGSSDSTGSTFEDDDSFDEEIEYHSQVHRFLEKTIARLEEDGLFSSAINFLAGRETGDINYERIVIDSTIRAGLPIPRRDRIPSRQESVEHSPPDGDDEDSEDEDWGDDQPWSE